MNELETFSEHDLDFLQTVFDGYAVVVASKHDPILTVSELDGFLTALVSAPQAIMPNTWLAELWDGTPGPLWRDEEECQQFMACLFRYMNGITDALMSTPCMYTPLLIQDDDGNSDEPEVMDWCYGYLRAVALGDWSGMPSALQMALSLIQMHATKERDDIIREWSQETYLKSKGLLGNAAMDLHSYWLQQRSQLSPHGQVQSMRRDLKAGRNDPCPCGSGKKYKKCCLH